MRLFEMGGTCPVWPILCIYLLGKYSYTLILLNHFKNIWCKEKLMLNH